MTKTAARLLLLAFASAAAPTQAGEVSIELLEEQKSAVTAYAFDTQSSQIKTVERAAGKELPPISRYAVKDRKVMLDKAALADAEEILYQFQADGADFLVVRVEHYSFSSPSKWLAALSGHPVQISTINILKVENGALKSQTRMAQKDASYRWSARILQ